MKQHKLQSTGTNYRADLLYGQSFVMISKAHVMAPVRDCLEFARQCDRLAQLCEDDPQLREHLLGLAREWEAMAKPDRHSLETSFANAS
jgi:hypothetical protein